MDLETFRLLQTSAGQQALRDAMALEPREADFLRHFQALSRAHAREVARSALEIAILRREAKGKFPFAEDMYFTREALEQATAYEVSVYRADRYRPFNLLLDLGCSVGGDSLAMASIAPVTGIDRDPLRLAMAGANARALNPNHPVGFLQADLTSPLPLQPVPSTHSVGLFFDPARRSGGHRRHSIRDYVPPLSVLLDWLECFPVLGVKVSPGVDLDELSGYDAEIEFISSHGKLKEATLWFGPLKAASRRATVLPGPHSLSADEIPEHHILPISQPLEYLYEPDPAILRAGLVADLGTQLEAAQLDSDIAYLTGHRLTPTPFARAWLVEDWFPFQLKHLRAYLRDRNVGSIVVKKRGSPIQPEELIRDLHPEGEQERVIFLTHLKGRPIVVICLP
ncbi:MAG TPA: class I SAM-dependent methyltransferase [Anaerolineales bacterium]|jgi:SAM-dependent methyltransferase|nr:class I SAM-dependent methyltransferase [Anaerolineales bacterium]